MAAIQGSYELLLMKENLLTGMETNKDIAAFIVKQQIAKT